MSGHPEITPPSNFHQIRDTTQLQALDHNVLQASSGAAAAEVLNQRAELDLLFTDVVMPGGMGGRDLADAARKIRPNIKILFTSGYTENSIVHNWRLDPASSYSPSHTGAIIWRRPCEKHWTP
ncbi:response regulator [Pelagibacterium montanilacus]|uniref:response regulator n=1 Tax=Pelagibacterium montanilacus TaxID=2185280 RepID=UPI001FEB3104|nr:response regulator [Pelagibacterium montanilacus]